MWWSCFDLPQLVWSSGWSAIGLAWSINHWWLGSDGFRPLSLCVSGLVGVREREWEGVQDWLTNNGRCVCLRVGEHMWQSVSCGAKALGVWDHRPSRGKFYLTLRPSGVYYRVTEKCRQRYVTKPWLCVNSYYGSIVSLMSAQGKFG